MYDSYLVLALLLGLATTLWYVWVRNAKWLAMPGPFGHAFSVNPFVLRAVVRPNDRDMFSRCYAKNVDTFHVNASGRHLVVTKDRTLVRALNRQREAYPSPDILATANSYGFGPNMFNSKGEEWRKRHLALRPFMRPSALAWFVPAVHADALALCDRFAPGTAKDVCMLIKAYVTDAAAYAILGVRSGALKDKRVAGGRNLAELLIDCVAGVQPRLMMPQFLWPIAGGWRHVSATAGMRAYLQGVIDAAAERAPSLADDSAFFGAEESASGWRTGRPLLAHLLSSSAHKTDDDVIGECFSMFAAGCEPTSNTLCFAVHCLASDEPRQQVLRAAIREAVRDKGPDATVSSLTRADVEGIEYLGHVIRESMRLFPAAHLLLREVGVDDGLYEKGTGIVLDLRSLNRAPDVYEDPDAFRPERWQNPTKEMRQDDYAFGRGKRICFGKKFASIVIGSALCALVDRFVLSIDPSAPPLDTDVVFGLRPKNNVLWLRCQRADSG